MTISAIVVGLGQIGMGYDLHAESQAVRVSTLARAFSQHPGFKLVAGVDSNQERRELFTSHYGISAFSSVEQAFNCISADLIVIAVPTNLHYKLFLDVIKFSNIKAVLCEKPLSYSFEEAKHMVQISLSKRVRFYTNYMRRCDRAVVDVRNRILTGQIKSPLKGVCWYSKGLYNSASHFINLLQFWMGDVKKISIIDVGRLFDGHDPEPDFKVLFELGEVYFHASREENFSYNSIELLAINGRLRYESGSIAWQHSVTDSENAGYVVLQQECEFFDSDHRRLQWFVADQISNDLSGLPSSICTGFQGLSTSLILEQIVQQL